MRKGRCSLDRRQRLDLTDFMCAADWMPSPHQTPQRFNYGKYVEVDGAVVEASTNGNK